MAWVSVANCNAPVGVPVLGARVAAGGAAGTADGVVVRAAGLVGAGAGAGAGCAVVVPARHFST